MPRMSKKRKEEWAFFLNEHNRTTYNSLCRKCVHRCKQSFRAIILECPRYHSKRSVTNLPREPSSAPATFSDGGEE